MTYRDHPDFDQHEEVHVLRDDAAGLHAIIVMHSTHRGPAAGGCRLWPYASEASALTDALRLSRGMSMKNALADLPLGGGKATIIEPQGAFDRDLLFESFGGCVEGLGGRYITAEDVGTTTTDMQAVSRATRFVSGLPVSEGEAGGNPAPWTARGVFAAIAEALRFKGRSVAGASVAVQGVGNVGSRLVEMLLAAGAEAVVCDTNEERAAEVGRRLSVDVVAPEKIYEQVADVFAPCAMGGVLDDTNIAKLKARILVGAANNQLATDEHGLVLEDKGFLYVPDFVVNAGGIVCCAGEYLGWSVEEIARRVDAIGPRVKALLERSSAEGAPPNVIAARVALQRIGRRDTGGGPSATK